jgi:hypothetical protein
LANLWLDLAPSQNRKLRQRDLLALAAFALDNAIEMGMWQPQQHWRSVHSSADTKASAIHLQQPDTWPYGQHVKHLQAFP